MSDTFGPVSLFTTQDLVTLITVCIRARGVHFGGSISDRKLRPSVIKRTHSMFAKLACFQFIRMNEGWSRYGDAFWSRGR
jgi:hypothetical protein